MNEMVERVAVALRVASSKGMTEDEGERSARAAIAAMRMPTEAMVDRGLITPGRVDAYIAMIDEALKEAP